MNNATNHLRRAALTAIAESAVLGRTASLAWSPALGEMLLSMCRDYESVPGAVEMWGKDESGKSWTVRLVLPKSAMNG